MIWGFGATFFAAFCVYLIRVEKYAAFFDRWIFRTIHLAGIVYVASLMLLGKYCPLTLLENELRRRHNPEQTYPGSFMVHYIEELVYPEADFLIFVIPTMIIALFTVFMYFFRPPKKIISVLKREKR